MGTKPWLSLFESVKLDVKACIRPVPLRIPCWQLPLDAHPSCHLVMKTCLIVVSSCKCCVRCGETDGECNETKCHLTIVLWKDKTINWNQGPEESYALQHQSEWKEWDWTSTQLPCPQTSLTKLLKASRLWKRCCKDRLYNFELIMPLTLLKFMHLGYNSELSRSAQTITEVQLAKLALWFDGPWCITKPQARYLWP